MLNFLLNGALMALNVAPALDMAKEFSASVEAEAREAAKALVGLGACGGLAAGLLVGAIATLCLGAWPVAAGLAVFVAPICWLGWTFKKRLDLTLAKLESLQAAAVAARAAKALAEKASDAASAAASRASVAADSAKALSASAAQKTGEALDAGRQAAAAAWREASGWLRSRGQKGEGEPAALESPEEAAGASGSSEESSKSA
jgi:hypothetical protein